MSDNLPSLQARIEKLKTLRTEIKELSKAAFMAAPPMPGGGAPPVDPNTGMPMDPAMMGGAPPMDPAMAGGGMPPVDPNTGMPMDPAMMGGGGMPPVDPNTGMPMDPAMAGGAPPAPAPGGEGILTPEMLEELVGAIEGLAAGQEQTEQKIAELEGGLEEAVDAFEQIASQMSKATAV